MIIKTPQTPQPAPKQDYSTCLGKCIEKERFNAARIVNAVAGTNLNEDLGLVGSLFNLSDTLAVGAMSKVPSEMRGFGKTAQYMVEHGQDVTNQMHRWGTRISNLTGNWGTKRAFADFGASVVGKTLSTAATGALVFEGFYDLGAIVRCAAVCANDSNSY